MRYIESFNKDWYFVKASDFSASQGMEWESVTLPHTWNSIDGQDGGNDYFRSTCLYRKNFRKPLSYQEGNRLFLEFNGAAMTASVTVNDKLLKIHDGGYSTFRVDITEVMEAENQVPISGEHIIEARSGALADSIRVCRVEQPNPEYQFAQEGGIVNWFDKEDFKPGYFSIRDTMGVLQAHPKTGAIVGRMMERARASRGDVAKSTEANQNLQKMIAGMSLESLLKQAKGAVTAEQIRELNAALQQIKKEDV